MHEQHGDYKRFGLRFVVLVAHAQNAFLIDFNLSRLSWKFFFGLTSYLVYAYCAYVQLFVRTIIAARTCFCKISHKLTSFTGLGPILRSYIYPFSLAIVCAEQIRSLCTVSRLCSILVCNYIFTSHHQCSSAYCSDWTARAHQQSRWVNCFLRCNRMALKLKVILTRIIPNSDIDYADHLGKLFYETFGLQFLGKNVRYASQESSEILHINIFGA